MKYVNWSEEKITYLNENFSLPGYIVNFCYSEHPGMLTMYKFKRVKIYTTRYRKILGTLRYGKSFFQKLKASTIHTNSSLSQEKYCVYIVG